MLQYYSRTRPNTDIHICHPSSSLNLSDLKFTIHSTSTCQTRCPTRIRSALRSRRAHLHLASLTSIYRSATNELRNLDLKPRRSHRITISRTKVVHLLRSQLHPCHQGPRVLHQQLNSPDRRSIYQVPHPRLCPLKILPRSLE